MRIRTMAVWGLVASGLIAATVFLLGLDRAVAWWRVRQLLAAEPQARALVVDQLARHPVAACHQLLDVLLEENDNERALVLGDALTVIGREPGGAANEALVPCLQQIVQGFKSCPASGREQAAQWVCSMIERMPEGEKAAPEFLTCASRLVEIGRGSAEAGPRAAMLRLATSLAKVGLTEETVSRYRELARAGLADNAPSVQLAAISLAMLSPLRIADEIAPCLSSSSSEVRRAALVVLGPTPDAVTEDAILPLLHDSDEQNAALARSALFSRGLSDDQIRLGRLLAHPSPAQRLLVIDHLDEASHVDVNMWLKRLSHDTSPAVRSAAARAMAQAGSPDLTERLNQMAEGDPSPTVSRLTRHFMSAR